MIERFRLPDLAFSVEGLVDLVGGGPFDRIHDLRQGANFHGFIIDQRGKDEMNVIGHDHGNLQIEKFAVVMQAGVQNDRSDTLRQDPSVVSAESHKVRLIVTLQMRKLPPIKRLGHDLLMETPLHM